MPLTPMLVGIVLQHLSYDFIWR